MNTIVLNTRKAGRDVSSESEASGKQAPRSRPRVERDELTGLPVVTARPGTPSVTSEMVRALLEDFP